MTLEELKTFKELIADGLNSSRDIIIECAEGDLARAKLEAISTLNNQPDDYFSRRDLQDILDV